MTKKMKLSSQDVAERNRHELKQLFPSVFTETHADDGDLVESIDFEKLKAELGNFSDVFDARRERFGMDWPGKKDCMKLIQQPSIGTLNPCREESVSFDTTKNLFIEGDNLEVLKLLQKAYYGKVKIIYIDPPYNTGGDFIYPDDYSETLDTYLAFAGLIDAEGKKFSTNTANEGRYHSKWMNMMFPRLYLARNLLVQDGLIFVSIDDTELPNLRMICNEIFGEENFVSQVIWKKAYGGGAKVKHVVGLHEYVLCYAKNKELLPKIELPPNPDARKYYKNKDDKFEIRGPYRTQPLWTNSMDERENLRFGIPYGDEEIWPEKQWQWEKPRVMKALEDDELVFVKSDEGWSVYYKQYLRNEEGEERGAKPYSVLDGPYTQKGTGEIESFFGDGKVFSFPKPSELLKHLISYAWSDEDAIFVDFFAGSSSLAQAVMSLNKQQGGRRRFIVVQLPERLREDKSEHKPALKYCEENVLKPTLAEISKQRIRLVGNCIREELQTAHEANKQSLPGMGESVHEIDMGFRVLKLDKSNFRLWTADVMTHDQEQLERQLELHADNVEVDSTSEEILFELMLKAGFELSEPVNTINIGNVEVYSLADGALLICLAEQINQNVIDKICELDPLQFICLDKSFDGNDQLKTNAVQTFAASNQGREKADQIVFRTV